jgi:hypothetical protein
MSIKITKAEDPIEVNRIVLLAYSAPGVGKTSLGFTSANPLLLDFDEGAYGSEYRKASVQVRTWEDIAGLTAEDLAPYSTVCVDTVGRLLDALTAHLITQNPKVDQGNGVLTMRGWGDLKGAYTGWLKKLLTYGKDVVLLAHEKEEKEGDSRIFRPDIQGGSFGEVFKRCDNIGYLYQGAKGRVLDFNPTDRWIGKNRGALPAIAVPHYSATPDFLAQVIGQIKGHLNRMSQQDDAAKEKVESWRALLSGLKTADDLTAVIVEVRKTDGVVGAQVRALVAERAKALGLKWEGPKGSGRYAEIDAKPA